MKLRLAILIVLTAGILFPNPQPAVTAANVDVQQLRYKFKYTCNGETIVVFHCRHDDDTPQFAPTKPENDYCQVSYPDRALRNGFRVETVELLSDVVKKLQSCGAFNPPSNVASNAPSTVTTPANVDVDKSIEAYITQGDQYREAKKYPEAIAAYQKANSLKPTMGAYGRLGLVYVDGLKQYSNALAAFQSALLLKPDEPKLHYNLGKTYLAMEQYINALNAFKEALRLKPDMADASNALAVAYFNLDQYSEALAAQKEAIRLAPNDATFILNLGAVYLDLGRKEEALATCNELQRVDPAKGKKLHDEIDASFGKTDDAQTNLFLAVSFYDLGDRGYRYALRILRRIVLLKAEADILGNAHYVMGKIFTDQKKPTVAAAEFEKGALAYQQAIRLHPREADNYDSLGRVYIAQGRKDAALRVYKTLQTLDPAQAKKLYEEINNAKTTAPIVEDKTSSGPQPATTRPSPQSQNSGNGSPGRAAGPPSANSGNNVTAIKAQAEKYWDAEDYPNATVAYKRLVALEPSNVDAHHRLAFCYYQQQQWQLSIESWNRVLILKPEANAYILLGLSHRSLKHYDLALKAFRSATALKQDTTTVASAHLLIGRTYLEMGKKEEALQVYKTLQGIDRNMAQQLLDEINKQQ